MMSEKEHTDYPHAPGTLYDCHACETECFCHLDRSLSWDACVHCAMEWWNNEE